MTEGRCADLSEAAGEPLAATATTAESWLLVEVPGTWPRDVAGTAALGAAERAATSAWLEKTPSSRLLFIRRPGRPGGDRRLVFAVRATEREPAVRRFALEAATSLAEVDFDRDGEQVDAALVLVCGHGSRDACCALRGTAVHGALAPHLGPDELWLSSHHGGHRFAANVLVLPGGVHLGRVAPEQAPRIVREALAGTIDLEHYRGRTTYTQRQQAAERLVRESGGFLGLGDLILLADDGTYVRFRDRSGDEHRAVVEVEEGPTLPASCGADPTPQQLVTARPA